ncbi:hypothetical protein SAMN05216550_14813 [Paraburkholderia tropica]|uniref:Cysteine rich repeat-containing protein n=1 Tax=Paraburkholderia tropica TaxID=92647 RepID=A0AAQ1GPW4_9BURK|nr:hypothetical protein [Paraburkholderia tropica]SEK15746.1 hypothetical protein SAMN05216550_14813 [Paraburkholderia tropica]
MTKHTPTLRAAAWMLGFALIGVAGASHAASQDEQEHACRGDAFHFCASDIPNKEKITVCMKQHYDELSPPCKAMFKKPPKGSKS